MKNYFYSLLLLCATNFAFAQVPQGIPYQSAMRNSSGGILANQNISIRFSLHDSVINGTIVYQETHSATTNNLGLVSLTIGQGIATTGLFANINWAQHAKFLQVEMDPAGGTTYVDLGTQQMMSVPYALYAGNGVNGSLPIVSTDSITEISSTKAIIHSNVITDGGVNFTVKGFCYDTLPGPNISNHSLLIGVGEGTFEGILTELIPNTNYYVRSYATNQIGTTYGSEMNFKTTIKIGDYYNGGIVAYIYKIGDIGYISGEIHGLIAAPFDQSNGIFWHANNSGLTGATGNGFFNTNAIINLYGSEINAARICYDLVLNGFDDWYLPSFQELQKISPNKDLIGGFISNENSYYWSSTESAPTDAIITSFFHNYNTGYSSGNFKLTLYPVRAVRSF